MRYLSTRGESAPVGFADAVAQGLAPDGGLYLPEHLPQLGSCLSQWERLSYDELCAEFFLHFCDLPAEVLQRRIKRAYSRFSHPEIAPLIRLRQDLWVLELFHGPTLAFKDFALQLLGEFYEEQIARTGKPITVLGATSGDTGAAAIHGLLGKKGVRIIILYPEGRVSALQERQMACTNADNVYAVAVKGTFDAAQAIVKELFQENDLRNRYNLAAVNSINISRVLAQCVYYFYAWFRLPEEARATAVEFVVPTGNFGNVLAGWMAQKMGLPVASFCVATNRNDILHRLFQTGEYRLETVAASHAPSMDIQVASNFERFLYYAVGRDCGQVRSILQEFKTKGYYVFPRFDRDSFHSSRAEDNDIVQLIRRVQEDFRYVVDPHTACAFVPVYRNSSQDSASLTRIILATAHAAKFPDVLRMAIGYEPRMPSLEMLKQQPLRKTVLEADTEVVKAFLQSSK